ncbi:MAG TPA: hypothetical protein VIG46_06075 [Candidatus Baltobacteraceae bacterium]|jgi:hypothetical protein
MKASMKNPLMRAFAALLILVIAVAADGQIKVTAQLLDYEKGYVFFTSGDGFKVAPNAPILDYKTGAVTTASPGPRDWARATFDATGLVTQLELSKTPLAPEGDLASIRRFAVALSPTVANPDLVPVPVDATGAEARRHFTGAPVPVSFIVRVPPSTPLTASIYITTDQSAWNPEAIRMDRIDALHFRITRIFASGTRFKYLYTRGSLSTQEVDERGIQRVPRTIVVPDVQTLARGDDVYEWADTAVGGAQPQPDSIPTPYNPAPFPNLPSPGSLPTIHP